MNPRYPTSEPLVGSGDLDVGGQVLRDFRQRGFWARITAHPDAATNAYGFIRADDFTPATFPSLTGAIEQGDGVSLAAYEVSGSLTVPTDGSAIVWLEPLRGAAGYSFRYGAASVAVFGASGPDHSTGIVPDPGSTAGTSRFLREDATWADASSTSFVYDVDVSTNGLIGTDNVWNTIATLALPAAGTYLLWATVGVSGAITAAPPGYIQARVLDFTHSSQIAVPFSFCIQAIGGATVTSGTITMLLTVTVTEAATLRLQVQRLSGPTWSVASFGLSNEFGYLKLS
jgi:hypothetical protein